MPPRPRLKLRATTPPLPCLLSSNLRRAFSATSRDRQAGSAGSSPKAPSKLWLSELRQRVGRCLMFGCSQAQISFAAIVVRALATEWRELLAGSEGYLTGGRRGLSDQQVAWGEMDSFGHVNNVKYLQYAELARVNWINNFAIHVDPAHRHEWATLMKPQDIGLIMKSITCDFKFAISYPDTISVYHKLISPTPSEPSATSILLQSMVLSHKHRRIAARTHEDVAIYDYRIGKKMEMPRFMRDAFQDTFRLQEEEQARATSRIWELTGMVKKLEKETWDREDAQEDTGNANNEK